jgi:hypothetical protein
MAKGRSEDDARKQIQESTPNIVTMHEHMQYYDINLARALLEIKRLKQGYIDLCHR